MMPIRYVLALPLAIAAMPSHAQSLSGPSAAAGVLSDATAGSRSLSFEGAAEPACLIRSPAVLDSNNASVTVGSNSNVDVALSSGGFVDPGTGVPNAAQIKLSLPVTCNTAHHITVESARGGLVLLGSVPQGSGFRSRLDFTVTLNWAGGAQSFNTTTARTLDAIVPNAATGAATIEIAIPGGGTPLVAGAYSDTVTVKVEATS